MPFGGAERVASSVNRRQLSPRRHQCLSAERSEWPGELELKIEQTMQVTNAFRRSGASGHVSARRSSGRATNVTNAFRRSGASGRHHACNCGFGNDGHQCLSAERSEWPDMKEWQERCTDQHVTNAFRRSGASGRSIACASESCDHVTNAFRRSGASGLCWSDRETAFQQARHQCLSAERSEWP